MHEMEPKLRRRVAELSYAVDRGDSIPLTNSCARCRRQQVERKKLIRLVELDFLDRQVSACAVALRVLVAGRMIALLRLLL